jgi:hypothetical protein
MSFSITGDLTNKEPRQVNRVIQDAYFAWLYDLVFDVWDVNSDESFTAVSALMHQVIFTPLVPYDENRIADAARLRNNFHQHAGELGPAELHDLMMPDASVFEVLIALADSADFMVPLTRKVWFRIFLENLKLDRYTDQYCRSRSTWTIERTINVFNNRAYQASGRGGIFPLRRAPQDQRKVELWYQMGAYMTDNAMY